MLSVSAEPEVPGGSGYIWVGSLRACLYPPCSLTGVYLVGREGWCPSATLPGEGQGVRLDKSSPVMFPEQLVEAHLGNSAGGLLNRFCSEN